MYDPNQYKKNLTPNVNEKYNQMSELVAGVIVIIAGIYIMISKGTWMGIPAILLGIMIIVRSAQRLKNMADSKENGNRLLSEGRCIQATLNEVIDSWDYGRQHINGIKLRCSYTDENTGRTYTFTSDTEYKIPSYAFKVGDPVKVYVEWNNYDVYYVDVENSVTRRIVDCT